MVTSREKKAYKKEGKTAPLHEWSGTIWHTVDDPMNPGKYRKAITREGKFKDWKRARMWVIEMLKQTKYVYYAEVAHVEGGEDVEVIKFTPVPGGHWTEMQRKKPWFGDSEVMH